MKRNLNDPERLAMIIDSRGSKEDQNMPLPNLTMLGLRGSVKVDTTYASVMVCRLPY